MAPRGIVAAAISAIFALRLSNAGIPQTEYLVPLIFMVIICTVGLYGLTAPLLARWLKLSEARPQGILVMGAHDWARQIAHALQKQGIEVLLVEASRHYESAARMAGFRTYYGNVLSEHIFDELDLNGIGRLFALTPNDEANALDSLHFSELFGRPEVYQLAPEIIEEDKEEVFSPLHLGGRFLFDPHVNYWHLSDFFHKGAVVKTTRLSEDFDFDDFIAMYGESAIPLFLFQESGNLSIFTADDKPKPAVGDSLTALVIEPDNVKSE